MKQLLLAGLILLCGIVLNGCASVQLASIPKPAETAKLRVAVVPISGHVARGGWGIGREEFSANQYRITSKILDRLGYYEVVPEDEVTTVLAGYEPDIWRLTRNDAELARQLGRALYADYLMIVERGAAVGGDPNYYFETILVNVESGRQFGVRLENDRRKTRFKLPPGMGKMAYRQLFRDAKADLLGTALRKTNRGLQSVSRQPEQAGARAAEQERLARLKTEEQRLAAAGIVATGSRVVDYATAEQQEERHVVGGKRLIVYDLAAASDSYRPVALIMSEALREEILKRGTYNLVNRENLQQLLDEMKFQQSGLVDNAQAVQLGKGAGAQEIVTGNLGAVGRTVVLQSKRTDIQTMLNLSLASLKSDAGQEDLLLARLAEMVDRLLQKR